MADIGTVEMIYIQRYTATPAPSLPFTMSQQANGASLATQLDLSAYGLTVEEVHTLSQKCIEAKEHAYCT